MLIYAVYPDWNFQENASVTLEAVLFKEFLGFLKEYKVVSLAVAFVVGTETTKLVDSLVKNIFLPILAPLQTAETWDKATVAVGPITLFYGAFLEELINFIILAVLVFILARKVLAMEKENK